MSDMASKIIIAVLSFLLAILAAFLLKKRKVVEYDVSSMTLLKFKPKKERPLVVSFDKFVLTGNEADKGVQVPVNSAYGFEIDVMNSYRVRNSPCHSNKLQSRSRKSPGIS